MSYSLAEIIITGTVQGVGYRYFCLKEATKLNLKGWVKNLSDGSVLIRVVGNKNSIELFCKSLQIGPYTSIVKQVECTYITPQENYNSFEIKH